MSLSDYISDAQAFLKDGDSAWMDRLPNFTAEAGYVCELATQRDELAEALRIAKEWLPALYAVMDPSERREIEKVNSALARLEQAK
jgi:hypothetical protein